MELDARAVNAIEMILTAPSEVELLQLDPLSPVLSTAALPISHSSDAVAQLPVVRSPMYSLMQGQVMTDEQLEILRRQICVYATICQQLVEMHKAVMAQQGAIPGLRLGQSIPYDLTITTGHNVSSRQRWTPSQTQLQILEKLFEQGIGTPNKQRIKEIAADLIQHGPISETNVYNWFQNRRARTKRKQQLGTSNNGESELDTDVDSPKVRKGKYEIHSFHEVSGADQNDINLQSSEETSALGQVNDQHQFEGLQSAKLVVSADINCTATTNKVVSIDEYACVPGRLQGIEGKMVSTDRAIVPLKSLHAREAYTLMGLGHSAVAGAVSLDDVLAHNPQQLSVLTRGPSNGSYVHFQTLGQFHG